MNTDTLTKRLAGPSTAKAGMDAVDQAKVNDIIYKASMVCRTIGLTDYARAANFLRMSERRTLS